MSSGQHTSSAAEDFVALWEGTRAEIVGEWLPKIVADVLASPEIATGIADAGLNPNVLRQRLLAAARKEVLTTTNAQLEDAVNEAIDGPPRMTAKQTWRPRPLVGFVMKTMGAGLVAGSVLTLALSWTGLARWAEVLGLGALVPIAFGLLIFVSGVRLNMMFPRPVPRSDRKDDALERWRSRCEQEVVLPHVRRIINEQLGPRTRTMLSVTANDAPGLEGASESSFMVRTSSVEAFTSTASRLRTGAIGLAGPRGVGKTSLIEHFAGDQHALQVTVSAPVQYEPKDFVLHLFATVCKEVLREHALNVRGRWVGLELFVVGVVSGIVVSIFGRSWLPQEVRDWLSPVVWLAITVPMVLLLTAPIIRLWWWTRSPTLSASISAIARRHLENIRYLQTRATRACNGE